MDSQQPPNVIPPANEAEYQHTRTNVIVATVICAVASTSSVAARFLVRRRRKQELRWDDWLMVMALLFAYVAIAGQFVGLANGLGQHKQNLPQDMLTRFQLAFFAVKLSYQPTELCLKTSILLFYMRLFATRPFRRVAWASIIFTILWAIGGFLVNLLSCLPVSYFWDKAIQGGHCLSIPVNAISTGAISTAEDIFILLMPLPMIWKLHIDQRRKIALSCIFLLGFFVCITSVLRFVYLAKLDPKDFTFTQTQAGLWTVIETHVGIFCANLPLLRPLFRKLFPSSSTNPSGSSKPPKFSFPAAGNRPNGTSKLGHDREGFERMIDRKSHIGTNDVESQGDATSEVELKNLSSGWVGGRAVGTDRIIVQSDFHVSVEETMDGNKTL